MTKSGTAAGSITTGVAADYDRDTIKDINRKLPNLLVKNGGVALDELADEYGFESTCDLIDMFLAYTPKRVPA